MSAGKKRRGLSADDKRKVILGIYHQRQEPLNLKEIETYGSKLGVVSQTIKEVNQSLVDDFLVQSDKIGAANFYWSFPSKSYQDQVNLSKDLNSSATSLKRGIDEIEVVLSKEQSSRCCDNRQSMLMELQNIASLEKQVDQQIESLRFNDPEEIRRISSEAQKMHAAASRWTDNIYAVKTYLIRKKGMSSKEVDKILHIDCEFDYPQ